MGSRNAHARKLTIGIVGGLGPQAIADLFRKIVDLTPAEREQDHLHILIDNRPDMRDRRQAIAGSGPILDCTSILAAAAVETALRTRPLPAARYPHQREPV